LFLGDVGDAGRNEVGGRTIIYWCWYRYDRADSPFVLGLPGHEGFVEEYI
tara:strand:- start:41 stop:190 length:150 start_codon:yes stop_codon:yes gene_type:complete